MATFIQETKSIFLYLNVKHEYVDICTGGLNLSRFIDLDSPTIYKIGRDKFGNVLYSIPPDTKTVSCAEGSWELHVFDGTFGMRPEAYRCSNCNKLSLFETNYCCYCGSKNVTYDTEVSNTNYCCYRGTQMKE